MPQTLPQRLYLLCYTVDQGKFQLDNKPKGWLQFIHNKAHTAETPVRDQLSARGEVDVSRGKVMGLIPADRVTVAHPQDVRALQDRVRDTVLGGADPASIPLDELATRRTVR
ncbi:GPP34 family phosphoprotein [Streptomyces sp. NPDC051218]|uniref:GPP34 family phosphoprotein n=1 Tax=Streptomyces sp. NPDC051218 TaxID=3365645 RepID=UPI0037A30E57